MRKVGVNTWMSSPALSRLVIIEGKRLNARRTAGLPICSLALRAKVEQWRFWFLLYI